MKLSSRAQRQEALRHQDGADGFRFENPLHATPYIMAQLGCATGAKVIMESSFDYGMKDHARHDGVVCATRTCISFQGGINGRFLFIFEDVWMSRMKAKVEQF